MHIAWVNQAADFVGGAERYIADLAPRLAALGHRNTLLYGVSGWMEPRFTQRFDAAFPMVDLRAQLKALAPDVVYVHQLDDESPLDDIHASAIPSFRFLHDHKLFCLREHKYTTLGHQTCTRRIGLGCYPCLGFINKQQGIRLRTVRGLESELDKSRQLTGVIVGSDYMHKHALLHDFAPDKVHTATLYVSERDDAERDVSERDDAEPGAVAAVPRRDDLLVFVGALLRGKGLDVLLNAMKELPPQIRLRVLGSGAQEGLFREMVRDLGLADRVAFVGQADQETLERSYAEATLVVVPSRSPETFSFVGPEALLRGAPVVASNVGGMGEWLRPSETAFAFETCNASSLATTLRRALSDASGRAQMTTRGAAHVRRHLNAKQHIDSLLNVFGRHTVFARHTSGGA